MRKLTGKRGQGTLEYILVLVVILLAIIAGSSTLKTAVQTNVMDAAKGRITKATDKLKASP